MKVRIIYFLLAGVVSFSMVAVLLVLLMDLGRFKEQIESVVSEAAGREFAIDGALHLTVGRTIQVSAEEVRLAATEWSHESSLVTVKSFSAEIDSWSLVSGPVVVKSINISGVRVFLEEDEDRGANWILATGDGEGTAESETPARPSLPVVVNKSRISDLVVRYAGLNLEEPLRIALHEMSEDVDDSGFLTLRLSGELNSTPLTMNLRAGHIDDLIEYKNVNIRFSANLGEIEIAGDAEILDLFKPTRPEVRLSLKGPDAGYLTGLLGLQPATSGPLDLKASVVASGDRMRANVSGHFGEFRISGSAQFFDLQELNELEAEFSANGPNAANVANLLGVAGFPEDPFTSRGSFQRTGDVLSIDKFRIEVGQTSLYAQGRLANFPRLDGATASLSAVIPDVSIYGDMLNLPSDLNGEFVFEGSLEALNPNDTRVNLTASIDGADLTVAGSLTGDEALSGSKLRVQLQGGNLATIAASLDHEIPVERPYELSFDLEKATEGYDFSGGSLALGQDKLDFSGRVGVEPLLADTRLRFAIVVPDLGRSLADFGHSVNDLPQGQLEAVVEIVVEEDNLLAKGVTVRFANVEVEADVKLVGLAAFREAEASFRIQGTSFAGLLPPSETVGALNRPFQASANVKINASEIEVTGASLEIDQTMVEAQGAFSLEPMFGSGRMKIDARTPDIYSLSPVFKDMSVPGIAPLSLHIAGSWDGPNWTVDAFDAVVGRDSLSMNGTLEGPPGFDSTNLQFDMHIADIHNVGLMVGRELPREQAKLKFRLVGDKNVLRLSQLAGTLGRSDFDGDFSFRSGDVPQINIDFRSNILDLRSYFPADQETEETSDPTAELSDPADPATKVIPDIVVPLGAIAGYGLDARFAIGELNIGPRTLRQIGLEGRVENGALEVAHFGFETDDGGALSGSMGLMPLVSGAELWVRAIGSNLEIGLPAHSEEELNALPRYDLNVAVIAAGKTVRDMAGSANGYLKLIGQEGKVDPGTMALFTQDFMSELLNVVNPYAKEDPYSNLRCIAVLITVEDGQVFGDPILVVQSDRLNIFADAKINLKSEVLDADFNTVPQKGLGLGLSDLVNPYIKVGGTLANPYIALDKESALIEGGAAVATAGISILAKSMKGRFFSPKDPCGDAVRKAEDEFHKLERKYGDPEDATY